MVNHFEHHEHLTTKDLLYLNMHRYCESNKLNVFQYVPIQFVFYFYNRNLTNEIEKFTDLFKSIETVKPAHSSEDLNKIN